MKKLVFCILAGIAVLVGVMLVRAVTLPSRQINPSPAVAIGVDRDRVVARLAQAIQFKTISAQPLDEASSQEFSRLHAFLQRSFPRLHERLSRETVGEHSLLYTWPGKDARLKPMLLMAHMDVVPVDPTTEKSWRHPPFAGTIADGHVWGRGTMDDKASVLGILEAVEHLLNEGFQPERTVYLALGHDEEDRKSTRLNSSHRL